MKTTPEFEDYLARLRLLLAALTALVAEVAGKKGSKWGVARDEAGVCQRRIELMLKRRDSALYMGGYLVDCVALFGFVRGLRSSGHGGAEWDVKTHADAAIRSHVRSWAEYVGNQIDVKLPIELPAEV